MFPPFNRILLQSTCQIRHLANLDLFMSAHLQRYVLSNILAKVFFMTLHVHVVTVRDIYDHIFCAFSTEQNFCRPLKNLEISD